MGVNIMECRACVSFKTVLLGFVLASSLLISGCGSTNYVWYQAGKDKAAFMQDHLQCEEDAALFARYMNKRGDKEVIAKRMKDCMGVRGYLKVAEDDLPTGAEKLP